MGQQLGGEGAAIDPGGAQRGEGRGAVALGEAAAVGVGDEFVVMVGGLRQAEQELEEALHRGRGLEVGTAHDQRHARRGIVDDAGEMVGGGSILAGEDDVIEIGAGGDVAMFAFAPAWQAGAGERGAAVEAPAVRLCGSAHGVVGKGAAGAGIVRVRPMRGRERGGDVGAGAETGIGKVRGAKLVECGLVMGGALRLD